MFGYLNLEKGLEWYKRLLTLSLPEPRELNINPKNCIGTVISLNGHRKYFCMYHAKHPESMKGKGSKVLINVCYTWLVVIMHLILAYGQNDKKDQQLRGRNKWCIYGI